MFCSNCEENLEENDCECKICGNKVILNNFSDQENNSESEINSNQEIKTDLSKNSPDKRSTYNYKTETITVDHELNLQNMLENEREEILERDQVLTLQKNRFKPISTGMFFIMELLTLMVPLNIILLSLWAFKEKTNVNRKSFARSILIWYGILIFSLLVFVVTLISTGYPLSVSYWFKEFKVFINSIDL